MMLMLGLSPGRHALVAHSLGREYGRDAPPGEPLGTPFRGGSASGPRPASPWRVMSDEPLREVRLHVTCVDGTNNKELLAKLGDVQYGLTHLRNRFDLVSCSPLQAACSAQGT